VEVEREGVVRPMTARIADAAERSELWPRIVADHSNYGDYQRKTEREIPVVVLDPR
jgi:deazaflavin-dependent oxidoreductase (nitroreductase family)